MKTGLMLMASVGVEVPTIVGLNATGITVKRMVDDFERLLLE